jgi:hypothetical protein
VLGVSTVQDEGDTPLFQAFAQCTGIVISEPEVDDRRRKTMVLDEAGCLPGIAPPRRRHRRS